jgi:signal-transduction protein with cAMP-binding, CBS, and nucleotidyltransferase domain
MPHADILHEVPLFALLDDAERTALSERIEVKKFKEGDMIFKIGDPGDSMYVITAGEVELTVKTKTGEALSRCSRSIAAISTSSFA